MTAPNLGKPDPGAAHVVSCRKCAAIVYGADTPPADGQLLLTRYADPNCKEADCPHKTVQIETQRKTRPATIGDLEDLKSRVEKLEPKR